MRSFQMAYQFINLKNGIGNPMQVLILYSPDTNDPRKA